MEFTFAGESARRGDATEVVAMSFTRVECR